MGRRPEATARNQVASAGCEKISLSFRDRPPPAEELEEDERPDGQNPGQDGNFERISDATKKELEDSGWLKELEPDAERRREFMEWLEQNHGKGGRHDHLSPGSPAAQRKYEEWLRENPKKPGTAPNSNEPVHPEKDPLE